MKKLSVKLAALLLLGCSPLQAKKFYSDDPLLQEPAPISVPSIQQRKLGDYYDFFYYSLATPGERNSQKHIISAKAVNTLGEPMDGAWYTHRHYWKPMSVEQLTRGVGGTTPPSEEGPWTLVSAKNHGVSPGFVMKDVKGHRYFVKFDPMSNPEMATAADMISARFLHALGYHVDDTYLIYFGAEQLVLGDDVPFHDKTGKHRRMTQSDLRVLLQKVPQTRDGKYRALASLQLPGKSAGPFLFYGTRADDPNDSVPHEHRRDLRGYYVFCAWLNHNDSRAPNTLDTLIEENGSQYLQHHLLDFGATLGSSSTRPKSPRAGGEYLFSWGPTIKEIATLGLWVPHWAFAKFADYPAVGRFEAEVFDPDRWFPEYPNPAFRNRLPDDEFWAAKQVMAFSDEQIRAIVRIGELSDPAAENYLVECLIKRRDKIGKMFFAKVLPLDAFAVHSGELVFQDLAKKHGMGEAGPLKIAWSRFDNDSEQKTTMPGEQSFFIPKEALQSSVTAYYAAQISRDGDTRRSVSIYIRSRQQQAEVVGLDRFW
jgi:hypothetical protein